MYNTWTRVRNLYVIYETNKPIDIFIFNTL